MGLGFRVSLDSWSIGVVEAAMEQWFEEVVCITLVALEGETLSHKQPRAK